MVRRRLLRAATVATLLLVSGSQMPASSATVPGANGQIAFSSGGGIVVMNLDGSDPKTLIANGIDPAWSPDGKQIAFLRLRANSSYGIYVMNADGSNLRLRAKRASSASGPTWSPDGKKIAFASDRDEICAVYANGTHRTRLTSNSSSGDPKWSPDGARIAFLRLIHGSNDVYVMDPDGTDPARLTHRAAVLSLAWSPGGAKIVVASDRSGAAGIDVMSSVGGHWTTLTNDPNYLDSWPGWSPDGRSIVFSRQGPSGVGSHPGDIFVMNADGTDQKNLTSSPADDFAPSWQSL